MSRWQVKLIAYIIVIITGTSFLWAGYQLALAGEYIGYQNFYDTWTFEGNYIQLVLAVLEKELVYIDEENIREKFRQEALEKEEIGEIDREYKDKDSDDWDYIDDRYISDIEYMGDETSALEQLEEINRNLEAAKSFRYVLVNIATGESVTNFDNGSEQVVEEFETAIQWKPEGITFPRQSVMGERKIGRNLYGQKIGTYIIWDFLESESENYRLVTAFDDTVDEEDPFFITPYKEFQVFQEKEGMYVVMLILSFMLGLCTVIYLGVYAGKTSEEERVRTYWWDSVFYEFQGAILVVLAIVVVIVIGVLFSFKGGNKVYIGIIALMLNIWLLLALQTYTSIIRNLRKHQFAQNFLSVRVLKSCNKFVKNIMRCYKPWIIIAFFGVCFVNMVMAVFMVIGEIFIVFPVFVLFNLGVLIVSVRYLRGLRYIMEVTQARAAGDLKYPLEPSELPEVFHEFGVDLNAIQSGLASAVNDAMRGERMKTELITNVTHDLKNPLTSIINYVDLLKKEEMLSDDAKKYVQVLDEKAKRLKDLIQHVVEASKASSGNIEVHWETIDVAQLIQQVLGEYDEAIQKRSLDVVMEMEQAPMTTESDSKMLYRIIENLVTNIAKYSMEGSRVYIMLRCREEYIHIEMKNMSQEPLNIEPELLMERFVRGDVSRNTEGSGLGLSIAKSLAELLNLKLDVYIDGDLFKVTLTSK